MKRGRIGVLPRVYGYYGPQRDYGIIEEEHSDSNEEWVDDDEEEAPPPVELREERSRLRQQLKDLGEWTGPLTPVEELREKLQEIQARQQEVASKRLKDAQECEDHRLAWSLALPDDLFKQHVLTRLSPRDLASFGATCYAAYLLCK